MTVRKILRRAQTVLFWMVLLVICQVAGTFFHEVAGHGGTGLVFGGRIDRVTIWGCEVYPGMAWLGWDGQYGTCDVSGIDSESASYWISLGGSLSTMIASAVAISLLWLRNWGRTWRTILGLLSIWWVDMLTYTLPSWGLRRSLFWGGQYSEPYEAATSLGMPGWLFQSLVIIICVALAATTGVRFAKSRRIDSSSNNR